MAEVARIGPQTGAELIAPSMSFDRPGGLRGEGGLPVAAQPGESGQPKTIVLAVEAGFQPGDVPRLLEGLSPKLDDGATLILCDLGTLAHVDLRTVDALCRLAVLARRLGFAIRLHHASPELLDLLRFAGLDAVLPCADGSGLDPGRQPEQREEPLGVEEERDPADRPVGDLEHLE